MDTQRFSFSRRTLAAAVIIAAAAHLAQAPDALTDYTRPLVLGVLRMLGVEASDHDGMIAVGRLHPLDEGLLGDQSPAAHAGARPLGEPP